MHAHQRVTAWQESKTKGFLGRLGAGAFFAIDFGSASVLGLRTASVAAVPLVAGFHDFRSGGVPKCRTQGSHRGASPAILGILVQFGTLLTGGGSWSSEELEAIAEVVSVAHLCSHSPACGMDFDTGDPGGINRGV